MSWEQKMDKWSISKRLLLLITFNFYLELKTAWSLAVQLLHTSVNEYIFIW